MPTTNALFTAGDLKGLLGYTVDHERVDTVERLVWGRVKRILGINERLADQDDQVWAITLQLGGYYVENPTAAIDTTTSGSDSTKFTAREQALLDQLANVVSNGDPDGDGVPTPVGAFPAAQGWPDPACVRGGRIYYR